MNQILLFFIGVTLWKILKMSQISQFFKSEKGGGQNGGQMFAALKTPVKYGSTIFYHLLQNKSVGVWRYTHVFWKVLCTHFFQKCLELYRGNIFQVFVELQWDSFEIIYPIENLHVEAFSAVFALFFYQISIICKKWATFWSTDAKNLQINFCPLIF